MKEKAINYHRQGFSCSESVVLAAIDEGLCDKNLLSVATSFSGGMSSGCLCGAIAGAQIVFGSLYGKNNLLGNEVIAKTKAKNFIDEFKKNHKATCCRVLSAGFEFGSPERRSNCEKIVGECAEILEVMTKEHARIL